MTRVMRHRADASASDTRYSIVSYVILAAARAMTHNPRPMPHSAAESRPGSPGTRR